MDIGALYCPMNWATTLILSMFLAKFAKVQMIFFIYTLWKGKGGD